MVPLVSYHFEKTTVPKSYIKKFFHTNILYVVAALILPLYKTERLHLIPMLWLYQIALLTISKLRYDCKTS